MEVKTNVEIKLNKRFEIKDLPDMKTIREEVDKYTKDLELGQTLFCKEHGVKTEGEYKKQCMKNGHIMKHSHIGYNTWETTKKAVEEVYTKLKERGSYIDRFGFCLDNLMGLPPEWREGQLKGTGLIFNSEEEWMQIGQIVPVQPHCGDMMVATLNGLDNCINALKAGVTTIGNASHYYTYEWPGFDKEEYRTINTIESFGVMGKFKEDGVILHSNLDDGFGGQMHDLANLAGWSRIERYYCEDLMGAGLGHCFGNLFSNPIKRIIFKQAIWQLNPNHIPGTMIYGNTTEFGTDFMNNEGSLASFILGDIIAQLHEPNGSAITPIPVSEAVRIPTVDEMVEANRLTDKLIEKAHCFEEFLDWDRIDDEAELLVTGGKIFFERVMNGLDSLGVDVEHPGEIMGTIKAIGPAQLEQVFGVGEADKKALRGRIPVRATDAVLDLQEMEHEVMGRMSGISEKPLEGVKIVIAATDVHEFGKQIVKDILDEAGATVFDLGTAVSTDEIMDSLVETGSKVVFVSTYNGIAYSYGKELKDKLQESDFGDVGVSMGGLLNEDLDGDELAEDVTDKLKDMGIYADNKAEESVNIVKKMLKLN